MHEEDLRTRIFLGIMEPPRWNTGIWKEDRKLHFTEETRKILLKRMWRAPKCRNCASYRAHGDRDVKVLVPVVLLESLNVKPNLRNKNAGWHGYANTPKSFQKTPSLPP